jgi:putative ABC transport system permease protein
MTTLQFILQQARYRKWRTGLTVGALGLVVLCFLLIQTASSAWKSAAAARSDYRVAVWNSASNALDLPRSYVERVGSVPGVSKTTFATFVEASDPLSANGDMYILGVDAQTYFDVYPETSISRDELQAWKGDPNGIVVSRHIAETRGYTVGQRVQFEGKNYPGTWRFVIRGIYSSNYKTFEDNLIFFHWEALNDRLAGDPRRNEISFVMALVDEPRSMAISKAIEQTFAADRVQVRAMTERSMVGVFMSNFSGILGALNVIGGILVLSMALITLNLVVARLRERKYEIGVLRAIGFSRPRIVALFSIEALLVGALGGVLGVLLSLWVIDHALGKAIEESLGSFFPTFAVPEASLVFGVVLPAGLALVVALIQASRVSMERTVGLLRGI